MFLTLTGSWSKPSQRFWRYSRRIPLRSEISQPSSQNIEDVPSENMKQKFENSKILARDEYYDTNKIPKAMIRKWSEKVRYDAQTDSINKKLV